MYLAELIVQLSGGFRHGCIADGAFVCAAKQVISGDSEEVCEACHHFTVWHGAGCPLGNRCLADVARLGYNILIFVLPFHQLPEPFRKDY